MIDWSDPNMKWRVVEGPKKVREKKVFTDFPRRLQQAQSQYAVRKNDLYDLFPEKFRSVQTAPEFQEEILAYIPRAHDDVEFWKNRYRQSKITTQCANRGIDNCHRHYKMLADRYNKAYRFSWQRLRDRVSYRIWRWRVDIRWFFVRKFKKK